MKLPLGTFVLPAALAALATSAVAVAILGGIFWAFVLPARNRRRATATFASSVVTLGGFFLLATDDALQPVFRGRSLGMPAISLVEPRGKTIEFDFQWDETRILRRARARRIRVAAHFPTYGLSIRPTVTEEHVAIYLADGRVLWTNEISPRCSLRSP